MEIPHAVVERVAGAFLKSDGDLPLVYSRLLESPEAWAASQTKFKTPEDLVFSTLRASDTAPSKPQDVIRSFDLLGQRRAHSVPPFAMPTKRDA